MKQSGCTIATTAEVNAPLSMTDNLLGKSSTITAPTAEQEWTVNDMTDTEKKMAFLLATSPYLDTLDGKYEAAAKDLVANGVVPVVRCKDCKRREIDSLCEYFDDDDFCSHGERKDGDTDG